jgi:hypothetical protein
MNTKKMDISQEILKSEIRGSNEEQYSIIELLVYNVGFFNGTKLTKSEIDSLSSWQESINIWFSIMKNSKHNPILWIMLKAIYYMGKSYIKAKGE